jgi:hypothetical protein
MSQLRPKNTKMLYFALRAFGFLITNINRNIKITIYCSPHSSRCLFFLSSSLFFHPSPCRLRSIFLPIPFSFSHFAACVRSSHCPRVTSCFSLSSPSFPFLFSLSSSPPLQPAIILLTHTLSPPYCTSILLFSLLLICVFVPLPFYSPSPCTFSRRVVFLFSPSSSEFSSVSPVSHPF